MKREPGYYWVKINPVNWRIGYYDRYWLFVGSPTALYDSDFIEIDERRIEHEN